MTAGVDAFVESTPLMYRQGFLLSLAWMSLMYPTRDVGFILCSL